MNLRLFCALPAPADVQDKLVAVSDSLRGVMSSTSISWVKRGNFHLTLSFLGDVEQARVDDLVLELRSACDGVNSFDLICQGLGCFPSLVRPRVIWAGLKDEEAALTTLQNRVATACAPFAQRIESKSFSGHITLGRIRTISNYPKEVFAGKIKQAQHTLFGRWAVSEVELMCSDLSQGAPRYSVLQRFPLT